MYIYAQLNENNVCVGISQLSGEVTADNMVRVDTFDQDKLWRKYENSAWSAEKFEPVSTAPLDEFRQLRADVDQLIVSSLEV
jgi:hypothetical protein